MSLIAELKRRNVFKVAAAYVVVAWLVLQVIDTVAEPLHLPGWVPSFFIVLLGVGFLVSLFLAWAYELTPEGVKKADEVDKEASIAPVTGQKINYLIIGLMAIALGYFVWKDHASEPEAVTESAKPEAVEQPLAKNVEPVQEVVNANIPEASIAVLPFVNMSNDSNQEYFSDGITEEILNVLAKNSKLKVAARTSSFYFKGKNMPIKEVAEKLEVAHVLEGSVRKIGDDIRITAQLIRASDGYHLWSEAYNRKLENIFELQEEIARLIGDELKAPMGFEDKGTATIDPVVYDDYLLARAYIRNRGDDLLKAIALLEQVVKAAPGFADAWASLSVAQHLYPGYSNDIKRYAGFFDKATSTARTAYQLNPEGMMSNWAMGLYYRRSSKMVESIQALEYAHQQSPNNTEILEDLAEDYGLLGLHEKSLELSLKAYRIDPYSPLVNTFLARAYMESREYDKALKRLDRALELNPDFTWATNLKAHLLTMTGKYQEALKAIEQCEACGDSVSKNLLKKMLYQPNQVDEYVKTIDLANQYQILIWKVLNVEDYFVELERYNKLYGMGVFMVVPEYEGLVEHPKFKEFVKKDGLVEVWRQLGWPEFCQPVGEDDFTCGWPE